MPVYVYECENPKCKQQRQVVQSMKDKPKRFIHCRRVMGRIVFANTFCNFKKSPGKTTGVYALDYGRRATEDLTVPGKFERLQREGRIRMPQAPARKPHDMKVVRETFGDATKAERKAARRRLTGNRTEI